MHRSAFVEVVHISSPLRMSRWLHLQLGRLQAWILSRHCLLKGDGVETGNSENVMGEGGHGLSLYVSRVSLYRNIDINTSFVFWFVLCQGCIYNCVQMYFYSDLLHWMELCGSRRRALLLYFCCCQKNSFVLHIWFYFRFLRLKTPFSHLNI